MLVTLLSLIACTPAPTDEGTAPIDTEDTSLDGPPVITHTPVESPWPVSNPVPITATITDKDGILVATLFVRTQTQLDWDSTAMLVQGPDTFGATISADELRTAGMHYYIEAVSNRGEISILPQTAPSDFFKFELVD